MNDANLKRTFRIRITKLISDHEGTWVTIAEDIGIPYGSLQALVKGKPYLPNPKMTTLVRISDYFKVTLEWLITGKGGV